MSNVTLEISQEKWLQPIKQFSKIIQKRSWHHVFNKMNMEKYVTWE